MEKRKITLYHVWGKTLLGKKLQTDVGRPVNIGDTVRIEGHVCKVVDCAKYQIEDRRRA